MVFHPLTFVTWAFPIIINVIQARAIPIRIPWITYVVMFLVDIWVGFKKRRTPNISDPTTREPII